MDDALAPSRDAPAAGNVLIASLLAPPALAEEFVSRPRMLRLLDRGLRGPVTLVTGEPASGKTTLMVDWLHSPAAQGRPVAWLTVPGGLDDELSFWRYLLAALEPLGIHVDDLRGALADGEAPVEDWLTALANRLGDLADHPVIVIDDLEALENAIALEALRVLLERQPVGVSFALLSRRKPPWSLAGWRMRGWLFEIDSRDLRFTDRELHDLLLRTPEFALRDEDELLLLDRTEGWAGGIKLALMSMRHVDDPAAFIARLAANQELMSSYLLREVLLRQPPQVRAFLLDASILGYFNVELCDAVRGRDDSGELLDWCRAHNLFVIEMDAAGGVFRLHGLFSQLLRATLEVEDPSRCMALHRRASTAYEEIGDVRLAIAHSVDARDDVRTGQLVARYTSERAHLGEFDDIRSWLSIFSRNSARELPETTMGLASALSMCGRADEALELLEDLLTTRIAGRIRYAAEQLRGFVLMARGDVDRLDDVAARLRGLAPPGDTTLPFDDVRFSAHIEGVGAFFTGDLGRASDALGRGTRRQQQPDLFYAEIPGWAAMVACAEGRLADAERLGEEAIARQTELGSGETAVAVPARLALADIAWERNRLDACEHHLVLARRSIRPLLWETVLVEASASRLRASRGAPAEALASIEEAGRSYLSNNSAWPLKALVAARIVDLALRCGEAEQARVWAETYEGLAGRAVPAALRIRLAHAERSEQLAAICEEVLATEEPVPQRIDTLLAGAAVALSVDDVPRARALVLEASGVAEPEGLLGRFCDAGPQIAVVVADLAEDPRRTPSRDAGSPFFLARIAESCRRSRTESGCRRPVGVTVEGLVEQLTERELQVLESLAQGLSYTEIGATLYVSRNTVKSHVQHVYTKLGTTNRAAAVDEARRLGLI